MVRKTAEGVFVIAALLFLSALLPHLQPGDAALAIAGDRASEADLHAVRVRYCLDGNAARKASCFLQGVIAPHHVTTLSGRTVADTFLRASPPTILLALCTAGILIPLGAFAAFLVTMGEKSILQRGVSSFMGTILTIPTFVLAIGLLYVFYFLLNVLPPGGFFSPACLVLPAVTLGARSLARLYFFTVDLLEEDRTGGLVRALRSRGYSSFRVVALHLGRKNFPAMAGIVLADLGSFLAGAVVVEEIFAFPGLGRVIYQSIARMDIVLLQYTLFYTGCLVYFSNRIGERLTEGKA